MELSDSVTDEQLSITGSSPLTAFWTLSLFPDCPSPTMSCTPVLDVFSEEYPEMDDYTLKGSGVGGARQSPATLISSVWMCSPRRRACISTTPKFTAMVLFQLTESRTRRTGPIPTKITR